MCADLTVIRLLLVEVLNEVIPGMPLPNDLARRLAGWLNFQKTIGEQVAIANRLWPPACGNCILGSFLFPNNHEDIAVGKLADVMVRQEGITDKGKVPNQLAVPGELL